MALSPSLTDLADCGLAKTLAWPTARRTVLACCQEPNAAISGHVKYIDALLNQFRPRWHKNQDKGLLNSPGGVHKSSVGVATLSLLITNVFSEVEMNSKVFDKPVYLKERRDLVREITCLEDAIDFLEEWPERDRDIIHDATLKTCYMAFDGHKPVKIGRDAIRSFGEKKGILVKSPGVQPWMIRSRSGGGRLSA